MKKKPFSKILFLPVFLLFCTASAHAYTDQITVKAGEAWQAALDVLKPYGFHKTDAKNYTLETNWISDQVVRKGKWLLKNVASKTYDRRYRITLKVLQRDYDTEIEIRGKFQERPHEMNSQLILWTSVKPESEDFDAERAIFMRILSRLELARSKAV